MCSKRLVIERKNNSLDNDANLPYQVSSSKKKEVEK